MGITIASAAAAAEAAVPAAAEAVAHNQVGFLCDGSKPGAARTKSDYPGIILVGIYFGFAARSSSHTHPHRETVSGQQLVCRH